MHIISCKLANAPYWENNVEGFVIFLTENFESASGTSSPEGLAKIEESFYPNATAILKKHKFKGSVGQTFALTAMKQGKLVQFLFIGIGKIDREWHRELEDMRRAVGAAVLRLKVLEVESAVIQLPSNKPYGVESAALLKELVIAAHMADYEFATFKSDKKKDSEATLFFAVDEVNKAYEQALVQGEIIGKTINQTRLLCDMPPNIGTPTYVSVHAKELAQNIPGLKCAIFGRERAEELGMGGFLAVDAGSDQDGKFVVLEYTTAEVGAPTIALVGKGVTFDSGGLSLKPSTSMSGMKFDMSGAAAVMGAMAIIAQLKPKVNVVGLTPLVENMPSGKASRQDDIIKFMNGKTAEILSTDAEGRLILADALCYAESFYKPDVMVDIATLTGACLYALGHTYTALMTRDAELSQLLQESGRATGDRVWELPLDEDFKPAIKSDVADIANCGAPNFKAGTITAGWFLSNFVEKARWAHLDIAGTADGVPGVTYLGRGATGVGVRLLVDFVTKYKK